MGRVVSQKKKTEIKEEARQASTELNRKGSLVRHSLDRYAERLCVERSRSAEAGPIIAAPLWRTWESDPVAWASFRSALLDWSETEEETELLNRLLPASGPSVETAEMLRFADQLAYNAMLSASATYWKAVIGRMKMVVSS
jgi:hypothetical protein